MGIYRRAWQLGSSEKPMPKNKFDTQQIDLFDKRPYSTDFSFSSSSSSSFNLFFSLDICCL